MQLTGSKWDYTPRPSRHSREPRATYPNAAHRAPRATCSLHHSTALAEPPALVALDMDDFTVEVHHGGSFAHDPLRYEGGTISLYKNNIRDYWSGLELKDMVGKLGYLSYGTLRYRLPTVSMEDGGLRVVSIDSDKDAMAMVDAVEGHNVIEMFVEHCMDVLDAVEEHRTITAGFEVDEDVWFNNVFEECNEGNEVVDTRLPDSSVEFSDSEESSDDDGHSNGANERCVRKLVTYGDMESDEDLRDSLYFGEGGIEQERIKTGLSDNDEAYLSEELLSMDDDDVRPQYPVYKPPKKAKYIKFEIGMKFNSLQEFKNAVTDYAVHGGHGIRFEKNDKVRVRAVCKKGCKWVTYAVKMVGEMTCQLRTFVNEHTCSRSYLNSRATSKWLGKKLTNRISEQPDMPCSTIQEKLLRTNGGSSVLLKTDIENLFDREIERPGREGIKKVEGDLCPNIRKKLSREKLNSGQWESRRAGNGNFEAAEDYVDQCYKISTYVACYDPIVMPINGPDMWEATGFIKDDWPKTKKGGKQATTRNAENELNSSTGQSNRRDRDSASASAAASKQLGSTAQATSSAHLGSNAHAQSTASVHGHSTASATATAGITSTSSIARANVEMSPSVPPEVKKSKNKGKSIVTSRGRIKPKVSNLPLPEIYGPPPSWRPQASISRETLMGTSQSARYREAFHILGSQESVHAPLPPPPKKGP
ncbi:hypothetical protein FCV25MIE_05555 [Fagus crenata]